LGNSSNQLEIAQDFGQNLQVTIAPLSNSIDQLLTHNALDGAVPFWQHPKWWQLANDTLFNGSVELVSVIDENDNTLVALPVQRMGGLLRSPEHPHLTVGESIWCIKNTTGRINEIMDALLQHLNAWAWQSNNSPDCAHVRLCDSLPEWQWRKVRESACFDTTGDMPIPGKLRRNLSRHERNLEATHGKTSYSIVTSTCANANKDSMNLALNAFLSLEASGWKGESGTAISNSSALKEFYQGMIELHDKHLLLEIHQLVLDSICIASQLAFKCGDTRYLLKICYDEEFAAFSPGSLLLKHTLQHCVENDTNTLSLVSAPAWAMRWKPEITPVWHVTRYANTLQGNLRHQLSRAKRGAILQMRDARSRIRT